MFVAGFSFIQVLRPSPLLSCPHEGVEKHRISHALSHFRDIGAWGVDFI